MHKRVIAVDLDGTLAYYDGWKGPQHIGYVIPEVANAMERAQQEGAEVWIFTARVSDPADAEEAGNYIKAWLDEHNFRYQGITAVKHKFFTEFWDDRGIQVIKNQGMFVLNEQTDEVCLNDGDDYQVKGGLMEPTFTPAEEASSNVADLLRESADVFEERGRQYGYIYKTVHPDVFLALFPNGIELHTHDDFTRFALINAVVGKLTRYANNFTKGGHRDSLLDLVNFAAMLNGVDDEISKR